MDADMRSRVMRSLKLNRTLWQHLKEDEKDIFNQVGVANCEYFSFTALKWMQAQAEFTHDDIFRIKGDAMLTVCRNNHCEIAHSHGTCPLCEALEDAPKLAAALADIVRLKLRIADLEQELKKGE